MRGWIDRLTSDPEGARGSYGGLFGWDLEVGPPETVLPYRSSCVVAMPIRKAVPSCPDGPLGQVRPGGSGGTAPPCAGLGVKVTRWCASTRQAERRSPGSRWHRRPGRRSSPTLQAAVGRPVAPVTVQAARGPTGSKQQLGSGPGSLAKAKLARPVQLPAPHQERARMGGAGHPQHLGVVPAALDPALPPRPGTGGRVGGPVPEHLGERRVDLVGPRDRAGCARVRWGSRSGRRSAAIGSAAVGVVAGRLAGVGWGCGTGRTSWRNCRATPAVAVLGSRRVKSACLATVGGP
jgi:hypothetical protein